MNRRARLLALALILGLARAATAQEITVSAAVSLHDALRDIGTAYRAAHPGRRIAFNFAGSGALLAQIAHGAPVDVFASADVETMDRAQAQELIATDTRINFAANELVLVSPRSSLASLKTLADLTGAGVRRIAVGNPGGVPAGRYAQGALQRAGLWEVLTPKLVFAEDVRQSLNYVSRAEVDAGFVYRTDALLVTRKVRIDFAVVTTGAVVYPIARVAVSRNVAAADAFIAFAISAQGQAVLARHGFKRP